MERQQIALTIFTSQINGHQAVEMMKIHNRMKRVVKDLAEQSYLLADEFIEAGKVSAADLTKKFTATETPKTTTPPAVAAAPAK